MNDRFTFTPVHYSEGRTFKNIAHKIWRDVRLALPVRKLPFKN